MTFGYKDQGLTLIQGPTGSGKSTLCDAIPWILFGKTAKGGAVDEIKSWGTDDVTKGEVLIDLKGQLFAVARVRGKAKDNDLYFSYDGGPTQRGKDLNDTQRLINSILGINYELYLSGAYFHEFSQTAQFFITTAKNRRLMCEQIVDLSLAVKLAAALKERDKAIVSNQLYVDQEIRDTEFKLDHLKRSETSEQNKALEWNKAHATRKEDLQAKHASFSIRKSKSIADLEQRLETDLMRDQESPKCSACGAIKTKKHNNTAHIIEKYNELIELEKSRENTYLQILSDIEKETNPFSNEVHDFSNEIAELSAVLIKLEKDKKLWSTEALDTELLKDVVDSFRSLSIKNTIQDVEDRTNELLATHFDSECKVYFTIEDSDKLDVTILKDGNECVYTQLSKGQRQLLKLCFGVSMMQSVSNHHGIKFHEVFFDEAFDGLDEQMKTKAYGLLSTIGQEYESVFVVEHSSELRALFPKSFTVQLVNGESQIE